MKKLFTVLLMAFVVSAQAQTAPELKPAEPETLVLKQLNHDFGKIQQGRPVTTIFEVTNVGKEPLTNRECTGQLRMHNPGMEL